MTEVQQGLPDFLIIGAAKAGTTSLARYLASHPDVFISPLKEAHYFLSPDRRPSYRGTRAGGFNREIVWRLEDYRRLFADGGGALAAGEASPTYLWAPEAPAAIRRLIPSVRLIAILRNPADRAYSHFCHNRRLGREPVTDFASALAMEERRAAAGWSPYVQYRSRGRYGEQIARYLSIFPAAQLRVYLSEDLERCPAQMLADICRFLGVDDTVALDTRVRHNVTAGLPRRVWVNRLFATQRRWKQVARRFAPESMRTALFERFYQRNLDPMPALDPTLRRALLDGFHDDLRLLERLLGRDLGSWLA